MKGKTKTTCEIIPQEPVASPSATRGVEDRSTSTIVHDAWRERGNEGRHEVLDAEPRHEVGDDEKMHPDYDREH